MTRDHGAKFGLLAVGALALIAATAPAGSRSATPTNRTLEEALRAYGQWSPVSGSRAPGTTKRKRKGPEPMMLFPGNLDEEGVKAAAEATAAGPASESDPGPRPGEPPRPWDLFLQMESSDVPDELLLAILIEEEGRGDPVERARALLSRAEGALGRLIEGIDPLDDQDGMGRRAQARLLASAELMRRVQVRQFADISNPDELPITSPFQAAKFLRRVSRGPREVLSAIYANNNMMPIAYRVLSTGSSRFTLVDPVEVFRPAVLLRANNIIMAHQHPSGAAEPSNEDLQITKRVSSGGSALAINLADSIVLGSDHSFTSIRLTHPTLFSYASTGPYAG